MKSAKNGGSSKEVLATTFNLKEQKIFEKTLQMTQLEKTFASKLHDLDQKLMRFNLTRLKQRAARITSKLSPDTIAEMRTLELEGKFKTDYPNINLGTEAKLQSAARRLKLNQPSGSLKQRPRPASASAHLQRSASDAGSRCNTVASGSLSRQGTAILRKEGARSFCVRRQRALTAHPIVPEEVQVNDHSPQELPSPDHGIFDFTKVRPATADAAPRSSELRRVDLLASRQRSQTAQRAEKTQKVSARYSCHSAAIDANNNNSSTAGSRPKSAGQWGDTDKDQDFGPDLRKELIKQLLERERSQSAQLREKTMKCIDNVTRTVQDNPQVKVQNVVGQTQTILQRIDSFRAGPARRSNPTQVDASYIRDLLSSKDPESRKNLLDYAFLGVKNESGPPSHLPEITNTKGMED